MAVFEVAIDQSVGGSPRPVTNVFHVQASDGAFPAAVASSVRQAWSAQVLAGQSAGLRCERVRVRELGGIAYAEEAVGVQGGNTEAGISPNVALLMRKLTPGLPRKRYGRMFIAGLSEAAFDHGGNVATNYLNDWTTRGEALLAALTASAVPMVQPSWSSAAPPPGAPPTVLEVDGLVPAARAATQKRRLRK